MTVTVTAVPDSVLREISPRVEWMEPFFEVNIFSQIINFSTDGTQPLKRDMNITFNATLPADVNVSNLCLGYIDEHSKTWKCESSVKLNADLSISANTRRFAPVAIITGLIIDGVLPPFGAPNSYSHNLLFPVSIGALVSIFVVAMAVGSQRDRADRNLQDKFANMNRLFSMTSSSEFDPHFESTSFVEDSPPPIPRDPGFIIDDTYHLDIPIDVARDSGLPINKPSIRTHARKRTTHALTHTLTRSHTCVCVFKGFDTPSDASIRQRILSTHAWLAVVGTHGHTPQKITILFFSLLAQLMLITIGFYLFPARVTTVFFYGSAGGAAGCIGFVLSFAVTLFFRFDPTWQKVGLTFIYLACAGFAGVTTYFGLDIPLRHTEYALLSWGIAIGTDILIMQPIRVLFALLCS